MSQRGETAFVAMRVGRIHDPREVLGLATELKVRPVEALGFVLLWEEFILEVGDSLKGKVRGYRPEHIAAKLTYPGKPGVLIRAMENAGVLGRQRNTFFHPYWFETVTGHYARQRAERREYEREKKRRQRVEREAAAAAAGESADSSEILSPGTTPGQPGDSRGDRVGNPDIKKERKGAAGPGGPPSPPQGGGGVGFARWEQILPLLKRPINPTGCILLLTAMSSEYWDLCLWVLENAEREGLSSLSRKRRAFDLDSYEFLRKSAFLQFRPEYKKKLSAPPPVPLQVEQAESEREHLERRRKNLVAVLSDPEATPSRKALWRRNFLEAHRDQVEWLAATERELLSVTSSNGVHHGATS